MVHIVLIMGQGLMYTLTVTYYHLVFVRTYLSICVRSLDVRNKTFKLSCNFLTNWILRSHNIRIVFLKDDTTFYFFKDDDAADTTLSEKYVCLIECLVPTKTKNLSKVVNTRFWPENTFTFLYFIFHSIPCILFLTNFVCEGIIISMVPSALKFLV